MIPFSEVVADTEGRYRVIYEIHDQVLLVTVVDIGHRREIYR